MNRFEGLGKPSTLAAGSLFLIGGILDQILRLTPDPIGELVQTPFYAARSLLLLAGALLLMLSLVSLYVRRAKQIRQFGFSAAVVAGTGTILISGLFWAQAFLYPTLGRVAPGILDGGDRPGSFAFGLLLTSSVFGVGWSLVGIAILRARVYRVVPAVLILLGGVVSLLPVSTLGQAVLGLGLVLLAFSPTSRKHEGPQRH
ncbi:hypothetical protein BJQ94_14505 [Cryobacterium sp. SO2]|uniref:hypothetical protein n=1 Tax=Cryobacterium sp. SO2 TaxID=1897060 RepID=UPI00223D4626|nr:hypothetical protein [Cryobacterium sp. SO2]WEO76565.1 hypothetical protein BJQ94_14505 [Cryobacterium sp. SO2]